MNRHALVTHGVNVRPRKPVYGPRAPEHNALRSRGCPSPERARPEKRREVVVAPQQKPPVAPLGFRIETLRRKWREAVTETRRLKAAGEPFKDAASVARDLRAQLVALDPNMAVQSREIEVSQGSESNPVKAT